MNNKGYLLAETCAALAAAGICAVIFYNGLSAFAASWQNLKSDLLLYRAARYSQSFIEHELFLNSSRLKITRGSNDKIVCTEVYGNRQVTFYRSGDPLSLAEVTLQSIKAEQLAADKIKVTLEFKDNTSGRSKKFTEVYVLANGSF